MLHRNVGGVDRTIRLVLGVILLLTGLILLAAKNGYGLALTIVGLISLGTGLFGFCGLYKPFGISTAPKRDARN